MGVLTRAGRTEPQRGHSHRLTICSVVGRRWVFRTNVRKRPACKSWAFSFAESAPVMAAYRYVIPAAGEKPGAELPDHIYALATFRRQGDRGAGNFQPGANGLWRPAGSLLLLAPLNDVRKFALDRLSGRGRLFALLDHCSVAHKQRVELGAAAAPADETQLWPDDITGRLMLIFAGRSVAAPIGRGR